MGITNCGDFFRNSRRLAAVAFMRIPQTDISRRSNVIVAAPLFRFAIVDFSLINHRLSTLRSSLNPRSDEQLKAREHLAFALLSSATNRRSAGVRNECDSSTCNKLHFFSLHYGNFDAGI